LHDVVHEDTETVSVSHVAGGPYSICTGLLGGKVIGLPPVLNFGSEALKARVVPEVFAGKKFICLAISEAQAGSDVMGLQTTAVKSEDGKEWIVNGTKKWITNAT
jgi:alkylation response protein AidB-like acyl-CoA dehydrogenase